MLPSLHGSLWVSGENISFYFCSVARDGCQALKEYVASMKIELPEPDSSQWMSRMVRINSANRNITNVLGGHKQ